MELELDALQELPAEESQLSACGRTCSWTCSWTSIATRLPE
ncbi:ALQxL family class IV lanthipeptide [Allokutzneria oryzae]|uniref:ALQxL family class IV lanthipeptide n=1 Tax=Allokutzneria oryzae TaxID=1378989 RepID=A0ABV5ZU71_9PSEU